MVTHFHLAETKYPDDITLYHYIFQYAFTILCVMSPLEDEYQSSLEISETKSFPL